MVPRPLYQRGSSLLFVMAILAFMSVFATVSLQFIANYRLQLRHENQRAKLAQIAATLQLNVNNAEFLRVSKVFDNKPSLDRAQNSSYQNNLYYYCAGGDGTPTTINNCQELPAGQAYYTFNLVQPRAEMGPCTTDPTLFDTTLCLVAGTHVGYNLEGAVGIFSRAYPIKAQAIFKPNCTDPAGTGSPQNCPYANYIQVGIHLEHFFFDEQGRSQPGNLGSYPKSLSFYSIPLNQFLPEQCNTGAVITGYDHNGKFICTCRPPYRASGSSNQKGPNCQAFSQKCPANYIMVGNGKDGTPECEPITTNSSTSRVHSWKQTVCFESFKNSNCSTKYADCTHDGPEGEQGGWISNVQVSCDSGIAFRKSSASCPDVLHSLLLIAGGLTKFQDAWDFLYNKNPNPVTHYSMWAAEQAWNWFWGIFDDSDWSLTPVSKSICMGTTNSPSCQLRFFGFTAFNVILNTLVANQTKLLDKQVDFLSGFLAHSVPMQTIPGAQALNRETAQFIKNAPRATHSIIPGDLNRWLFGDPEQMSWGFYHCPDIECRYDVTCQGLTTATSVPRSSQNGGGSSGSGSSSSGSSGGSSVKYDSIQSGSSADGGGPPAGGYVSPYYGAGNQTAVTIACPSGKFISSIGQQNPTDMNLDATQLHGISALVITCVDSAGSSPEVFSGMAARTITTGHTSKEINCPPASDFTQGLIGFSTATSFGYISDLTPTCINLFQKSTGQLADLKILSDGTLTYNGSFPATTTFISCDLGTKKLLLNGFTLSFDKAFGLLTKIEALCVGVKHG